MVHGTTYALWDKTDNQFLSWSWLGFKRARLERLSYINYQKIAILKVVNNRVICELNCDYGKPTKKTTVDLALAQSRLY